ncbi:hypothetical protein MuYL_2058 [Mucilaginibacter xinganensis]|uniref:Uncharacterized protein n=1 Tax=Mucilaginibacter xinganensis TaxID=1234841 RepID=A0A223NVZ6_9SPHI|nr:hypothetical protein MuYL_2058 [Mucilaginibacter xinganensis]
MKGVLDGFLDIVDLYHRFAATIQLFLIIKAVHAVFRTIPN